MTLFARSKKKQSKKELPGEFVDFELFDPIRKLNYFWLTHTGGNWAVRAAKGIVTVYDHQGKKDSTITQEQIHDEYFKDDWVPFDGNHSDIPFPPGLETIEQEDAAQKVDYTHKDERYITLPRSK